MLFIKHFLFEGSLIESAQVFKSYKVQLFIQLSL